MSYVVKEIFLTLQGEGANTGKVAVFCRFSGCNLWNGREQDRAKAVCRFCDTDFVGTNEDGGRFASANELAEAVERVWNSGPHREDADAANDYRFVVFTGGEPLLQLDEAAIEAIKRRRFKVAVESNGTIMAPDGIDHLCISPKANAPLVQKSGQELKLVYPQSELSAQPHRFADLSFDRFFLQPLDNADLAANTQSAIAFCMANPKWSLSTQTHKTAGIR